MSKTDALQRLDAEFWQTVDWINAGAWDALPAAELHSALSSFTNLTLSMDDAAKATWSEPIRNADDVAARAVLAKHYPGPLATGTLGSAVKIATSAIEPARSSSKLLPPFAEF